MKRNKSEICYKYKDGRFLSNSYMGDGDYELILTKKITSHCVFQTEFSLSEIINGCDGVYDDSGEYIADTLDVLDFTIHSIDIKTNIKIK